MHIVVITPGYPYRESNIFSFVKQLAVTMADLGEIITVIRIPARITAALKKSKSPEPEFIYEYTSKDSKIGVYRLNYNHFQAKDYSNQYILDSIYCLLSKIHAKTSIDALFCHFWDTVSYISDFSRVYRIPLFVANGESCLNTCNFPDSIHDAISGVICVSSKCKEESITKGYVKRGGPIVILPNSVDPEVFHPINKDLIRGLLGFPKEAFIVAFVGLFIHRKGADRVSEAIKRLNIPNIYSIFIGDYTEGDSSSGPFGERVLYSGSVFHREIPKYLACADVFCLPTLNEGCSNAIVEALACGLPIISSNLSFNDEILSTQNSIRINPLDIDEIANAILTLYNDPLLRTKMSMSARKITDKFSIISRAKLIIEFIKANVLNV